MTAGELRLRLLNVPDSATVVIGDPGEEGRIKLHGPAFVIYLPKVVGVSEDTLVLRKGDPVA